MKITRKIMLIIAIVLIVALAISNLMVYFFARNFVTEQENKQMDEMVANVQSHIEARLDNYLGSVSDWGHWDEPYDYLNNKNPDFVKSNITINTFVNLNLDCMVIAEKKTKIIRDKLYFDSQTGSYITFPEAHLKVIESMLYSGNEISDKAFVTQIDGHYFYLAISTITDVYEKNNPNGYLVFGKEIDAQQLMLLGHETNATVSFVTGDKVNSELLANLVQKKPNDSNYHVSIQNPDNSAMQNYVLYQDEDSLRPPVILLIEKSRTFFHDSMSRFNILTIAVSAMVLFSSLLIYYLLIRYVTKPLAKVTNEVAGLSLTATNDDGEVNKITTIGRDEIGTLARTINIMIEENHEAQKNLIHSEEQFRIMFEEAPLGIGLFDFYTGKVLRINRKFAEILHRPKEEFLSMDWQSITHPDDMAQNNEYRTKMMKGEINGFNMVKRYLTPEGGIIWINLTIVLLDSINSENPRELCMIEDISVRKQKEEEVVYLSFNDVLTGVYNRRFFEEEKKRLDTPRQLPFTILIADLDGLKLINDGFGYSSGDMLLKEAASILKQACRSDDIVARIGGDEFCILLPKTDGAMAKTIVGRIHQAFRSTHLTMGTATITPSISIGYACKTNSSSTMEEIIAAAEDSMRKSKLLNRKSVRSDLINSIKATMLEKSHETAEHAERMAALSVAIGETMGLSNDELFDLELAATLHDIGKMSIDHQILSKPGKLTDEEWLMIKQHPETGYRIANATTELVSIAEYILCHHERWDGKGYPQGLKGEEIPLISRIVSVVDSFDAMTENRPYRDSFTMEQAKEEIIKSAGSQFDPAIVSIFIEKVLNSYR